MLVVEIDKLEDDVFRHVFELSPRSAVALGLHDYDGKLPNLSSSAINQWSSKAEELVKQVRALDKSSMSHARRLDTVRLENLLERTLFDIAELRTYSSRPNSYTVQLSSVPYVSRDYAPLERRIDALNHHLQRIPSFLGQATHNLDQTLPKPIVDVSIAQANGVITDLETGASSEAAKTSSSTQVEFKNAKKIAKESIDAFVEDLKRRNTTSDFAIGKEKFQQIFWMNDKMKQPLEEILQLAIDDLESNLQQLAERGENLAPGKKVEQIVESIEREHSQPESLVSDTSAMLDEIGEFVVQKDLVALPARTYCRVVATPALMRATTTAAMNSPGPFEKEGLEGLYYVTPVEEDWDEKRKEKWLRHLNYTTLKDVSIHEVYPGHFTHRLFLNKFGASMTQKGYWNNAFGEGWAHYCEEMMLDQGYGDARLRFMQLKEALLRDCRFIVSIRMHTQGMTVQDATTYIAENAYMTENTASREALRGTFDHGYYGYTLGKLCIKDARKQFFQDHASATIRAFHDKLLGLGPVPVGLLEDLITI